MPEGLVSNSRPLGDGHERLGGSSAGNRASYFASSREPLVVRYAAWRSEANGRVSRIRGRRCDRRRGSHRWRRPFADLHLTLYVIVRKNSPDYCASPGFLTAEVL